MHSFDQFFFFFNVEKGKIKGKNVFRVASIQVGYLWRNQNITCSDESFQEDCIWNVFDLDLNMLLSGIKNLNLGLISEETENVRVPHG